MPDSVPAIAGRKSAYVARNRTALIKATQEVLAQYGTAATVELVAEKAEIAVSTIYKHFANKEALFDAAFIEGLIEWETWAHSKIADIADPLESLIFPMRLMMKVPQTHPIFAHMVKQNPGDFVLVIPKMQFGIGSVAAELQKTNALAVDHLDQRIKNLVKVLTLTFVELCTNQDFTEDAANASVAVALEMLGLSTHQIQHLMSAPLPVFT